MKIEASWTIDARADGFYVIEKTSAAPGSVEIGPIANKLIADIVQNERKAAYEDAVRRAIERLREPR